MSRFVQIPEGTPTYLLLAAWYCTEDDTLHPEDEEIAYTGTPNEFMAPTNEAARVKMQVYLDYLDECARKKAELVGRPYTGRLTDTAEQLAEAMGDAKLLADRERRKAVIVEATTKASQIPQRPDLIPAGKRKPGRPAKLLATKSAMPEGKPQPKAISTLGTSYEHAVGSNSTL